MLFFVVFLVLLVMLRPALLGEGVKGESWRARAPTCTHIPHDIMVVEPLLLPANDASHMLLNIIGSSKKPTARHLSVVQNAACYYQCHALWSCCVVMLLALMESRQGNRQHSRGQKFIAP